MYVDHELEHLIYLQTADLLCHVQTCLHSVQKISKFSGVCFHSMIVVLVVKLDASFAVIHSFPCHGLS